MDIFLKSSLAETLKINGSIYDFHVIACLVEVRLLRNSSSFTDFRSTQLFSCKIRQQ